MDSRIVTFFVLAVVFSSSMILNGAISVYGADQYSFVRKWGSYGAVAGKFSQPIEIAIDSKGYLYVTDLTAVTHDVQKFTKNGTYVTSWGFLGFGPGRFTNPAGLTVDSSDHVYVTDNGNPDNGIQKFTDNGTYITGWVQSDSAWSIH